MKGYLLAMVASAANPVTVAQASQQTDDPCAQQLEIPAALLVDEPRFIIVGETHGTDTSPEAFGEMVCAMLQKSAVLVQLEMPAEFVASANEFIQTGDVSALEQFTSSGFFTYERYDGRASEAFVALIRRFRAMVKTGHDLSLAGSQPTHPSIEPQYYYELAMAANWVRNAAEQPEVLNMILVGTYHAERSKHDRQGAAAFFLDNHAISLAPCDEGGTASVLSANEDGDVVSMVVERPTGGDQKPRGVHLASEFSDPPRYKKGAFDGFFCAGRPAVASPRAVAPKTSEDGN